MIDLRVHDGQVLASSRLLALKQTEDLLREMDERGNDLMFEYFAKPGT